MSVPTTFATVVPTLDQLRVVKATSIASDGKNFWMRVHDSDELVPVRLLSRPSSQIKTWSTDDAMVVATPSGNVIFQTHAFSGPVYLVTRKLDPKTGNMKNVRVTFYTWKNVEFVEPELPELQVEKTDEIVDTKPIREEGESFGKFQSRLRKWKKAQEVTEESSV